MPLPLEVIMVTPGLKYRIRFISATGFNCPVIVSVDHHRLTIIATDGDPITPFTTDSFVIYSGARSYHSPLHSLTHTHNDTIIHPHNLLSLAGERFDVVLDANQSIDNYWIRFNGIIDCS